jgi:hypothetical protein
MKLYNICRGLGFLLLLSLVPLTFAQTSSSNASSLPRLVRFGSSVTDLNGKPMTGVVGITFALYSEQTGGAPLWLETQNVTADANGHYTALLGSTKPEGLPAELFTSEQARWVGMQVSGQPEQPRVLLVSAPYALKAGDAETIGGLPPSAFVLAAPLARGSVAATVAGNFTAGTLPPAASNVTTTGGTANYLPLFSGTSTVIDSVLFQSGTGTTAKIGVNTATPVSTLDVKGSGTIRGILSLPTTGVATATAGKNSQPLSLSASAYNSSTPAAVNQVFRWQAEPAKNDTATPSGTLNLLFGEGTAVPAETGLHIASNGQITFASGQTFPGAGGGSGTVTSVATGTGLKGGPITTTGTLTIDTTVIPQLGGSNSFTGNQTVKGTLTATSSSLGVQAAVTSVNGVGINALSSATTGSGAGVVGASNSPVGEGVYGTNNAITGNAVGVLGVTGSTSGVGVEGSSTATTGLTVGVGGVTSSPAGYGTYGLNKSLTGGAVGVFGTTASSAGYGVEGSVNSPNGAAVYAANNSATGNAFGLFASSAAANGFGVEGTAPVGVYGVDSLGSAIGVLGQTNSGAGVQGQASSGNAVVGLSGTGSGVYGSTGSSGYGVQGQGPTGVFGNDTSADGTGTGVYGTSPSGYGVYGSTIDGTAGVYGSSTEGGYGVYGTSDGDGVHGASTIGFGVRATSESASALLAENNDSTGGYPTMVVQNDTTATHNAVFQTSSPNTYSGSRHCTIDTSANLTCTGVVSGSIEAVDGKQTAVYAMQSAENWLEDAGSGQLSNGSARIELDPAFSQTVNAGVEYHVFLTPKGDCKGLYVTQESPTGFGVRELSGGTSSIAFDYRIMAKRKGYENVRLEDLTGRFKQPEALRQKTQRPRPSAEIKSVPRVLATPSFAMPSAPHMPTPPVQPFVAPKPNPVTPNPIPLPASVPAVKPLAVQSK